MNKKHEQITKISYHINEILKTLGLDTSKGALKDTPDRVAKMYVNEVFSGLDTKCRPLIKLFDLDTSQRLPPLVLIDKIKLRSCCEHHLLPFSGFASVAYIPTEGIIGLSKVNRLVDYCSRKPQVQERLTLEIAEVIEEATRSPHIAVKLDCIHYCVCMRGVQDFESHTITEHYSGNFLTESHLRSVFSKN